MSSPETAAAETPIDARRVLTVAAPGRLHIGFLDPAGTLGRRFGSLGRVIDDFETEVELSAAPAGAIADVVVGVGERTHGEIDRACARLHTLREYSQRREPLMLRLIQTLPAHAGLGSGTQLSLAIGRAFARWHGLDLSTRMLAQILGRGHRSGVGIAGFDLGGLLLDGGPGADGSSAPLLMRLPLPDAWRIVVVQDPCARGLSGSQERQAIATLPGLSRVASADICHQILMRVMPGAATGDFAPFAAGVTHVQQVLGTHFAPAQSGRGYTSEAVGRLLRWIDARAAGQGGAAIGQSSWGPTGFAIVPSEPSAQAHVDAARDAGVVDPALTLHIVRARNHGAVIAQRKLPPQPGS